MKYSSIVWDGKKFEVPKAAGKPREDQLASTDLDNLCELSGKICYDSLGTGRNSIEYHKHINEVGHGSVQEHANLTFGIGLDIPTYLSCIEALINRPGIWICKEVPTVLTPNSKAAFNLRITANMRAIREWHEFPPMNKMSIALGQQIQHLAKQKAPLIMQDIETKDIGMPLQVLEPKYEDEMWVSVFFTNVSRIFSHELVRHKFRTGVSQMSGRYVDSSDLEWCWHPLMEKYLDLDKSLPSCEFSLNTIKSICKGAYKDLVDQLQSQLITDGTDKFNARKQARSAARGVLGNAVMTEMVFSASIAEWKWILHMRAAAAADAEIRVVMNEVYEQLLERFPQNLKGYEKIECPDKIGYALKEPTFADSVG